MMKLVYPIEGRDQLINSLKLCCTKINRPFAFEPIAMLFNRKIRNKAIYGNVYENSFWLRAYNAKGFEARLPGRYCFGHIIENGSELVVKISWRFTVYWPLMLTLIYLIFLIDVKFSETALFLSLPIYMVVCLAIFVVGIGVHEKEELQVMELLETIHSDICERYSKEKGDGGTISQPTTNKPLD